MDSMDAHVSELTEKILYLRNNMGTIVDLGYMPEFKEIKQEAQMFGLSVCSCLVCTDPVKDARLFSTAGSRGLETRCNVCLKQENRLAQKKAKERRKEEARKTVNERQVQSSTSETETEVMQNYLVPVLKKEYEIEVSPEFRVSDLSARSRGMINYIQIQLKTDGAFHEDGRPKLDNRSHKEGDVGRAFFHHALGYLLMLMVFIKTRLVDGELKRYIWVAKGSDIKHDTLTENADGTLGPSKIPPSNEQGMIDAIRSMLQNEMYHVSLHDIWMNVPAIKQFKEVANIQALKTVRNVTVPQQNQQAFDCFFDERRIQVKTHNVKSGQAHIRHKKNGIDGQPYSSTDPIDAFVIMSIIKCEIEDEIAFFMLYCEIGMDVMIQNKMVVHEDEDSAKNSSGKKALHLHPGIYEEMLVGCTKERTKETAWLDDYPFEHVRLYEHTDQNPQVHRLTKENLEKVAQEVADSKAMPACMNVNSSS